MGTPQFYGFAEIDMDYSQEASETERDRKKRGKSISLFWKGASSADSVLRMKDSWNVSSFSDNKICDIKQIT